MFKKMLSRIAMRHYRKKEKEEGKKYHKHFKFDDGRVFDLYSNEYIEQDKAQDMIDFIRKNISSIDDGSFDDIHVIVIEIMSAFFDFDAMVNIKVKDPGKSYEVVIIRNGAIDLRF